MKRLLCIVLATVALASCSKEEGPDPAWITLSQQTVLLNNTTGATASVTIDALGPWTIEIVGEGFDIATSSGEKGSTPIVVTALRDNENTRRETLGTVIVRFTANRKEYTFNVAQRPAIAPQTMLLYMPGQSLSSYYNQNFEGVKAAVTARMPGDGRILVCYQPGGSGTAELSEIYYDADTQQCAVEQLKTYTGFAPENVQSVREMLADMVETAPAQEYGLIIGCHGKGWLPIGKGLLSSKAVKSGMMTGPFGPLAPGALPTRSFGDSGHELEIGDLAAAIEAEGLRFSYLIFDACFMANIETLYDLHNAADRVIASPCEIMAAGFPYKRAVPHLFEADGTSHNLQAVCEEFWKFYMYDWNTVPRNAQSGCISLSVSSGLQPLADVMRRIEASVGSDPDVTAVQAYEPFASHLFYDLGDYVHTVCKDPALLDEFTQKFAAAFPEACRLHTPSFYSAYNSDNNPITYYSGVSISSPSKRLSVENQKTAWYQSTH